jgi:trehalose synthase
MGDLPPDTRLRSRDPAIHLFTNLNGVGNVEVNAFQRLSDVIVQKSLREGFGLVVSEALWKGTPVVAGRAGGIPLQLREGAGGFLVDSVEECADRLVWLLRNRAEARTLGERGRELVRERFLLTRLIADELRLYARLLGIQPAPGTAVAQVGLGDELHDPVCGMRLLPERALTLDRGGRRYAFCSESCRAIFVRSFAVQEPLAVP